jgi:glycosyltransferase involved in cell wall biosynthesis
MKVLFFTYDFPYPTNSGGKMRSYNLLKYAHHGIDVTLFSFVRKGFEKKHIEQVKEIGVSQVEVFPRRNIKHMKNLRTLISGNSIFKSLYYDAAVAKRLREVIEKENITVLHCESLYTAYYLSDVLKDMGIKQIYGSENIEHKLYDEYVTHNVPSLLKPFYRSQVRKVQREEEEAVRLADVTLAVTETEKEYFEKLSDKKTSVIENGVSLKDFAFKERKEKKSVSLLFVGNFAYFPNKEAVSYVYNHILKKIQSETLTFTILGKGASQFQDLNDSRIKTVEYIEDIADAYYEADIFVSPVKIGGGTNFKILEAMATGAPVVTFSARVKDIGAVNGRDVLTGDSPEAFREQVERLMADPKFRGEMAKNARKIIEEKFSWDKIGKNLNTVWRSLDEK